jgi:hypothetical protein
LVPNWNRNSAANAVRPHGTRGGHARNTSDAPRCSTVSLIGNIAHAVLPYLPHLAIQIGAAAVPPIALLAALLDSTGSARGSIRQGLLLGGHDCMDFPRDH